MPTRTEEAYFPDKIDPLCHSQIKYTTYFGTFVHTPELGELEILHHTAVGVDRDGTIDFILGIDVSDLKNLDIIKITLDNSSTSGLSPSDINIVDISNDEHKFFFPGFIDTHIHAPQFPNNGIFGNSTLLDWLDTYTFPLESSFSDLDFATEIYTKVINRTLGYGTTTASYYATIHTNATNLLADLCLKLGQRSFIGKVCMNQNSPDDYIETEEECKISILNVIDHIKSRNPSLDLINPVLTPRFAGSCTDSLLNWLGKLRKNGDYHCQTHLSENHAEIKWITDMFPQYDHYTDIYHKNDLLSSKTTLAHCIHLSDIEMNILKLTGSGVSHCPTSNSSITSGEARVRWLLHNNINVSLGTDCSGGFTPSILEVAKHALLVSRHVVMKSSNNIEKLSSSDVLYLATMGGAKVLKIDDKVGCFKKGLKFDTQLINLNCKDSNIDTFDFQNPKWGKLDIKISKGKFADLIDKWLFNGDNRNIEKVYVNGRTVINRV
jgi:guanine deaminase